MASNDASSSELHRSPSHDTLTGHVSQREAQTHHQKYEALPIHPLNLNFPTLNDDGSIPDLTAHQSGVHPYPPTPPAALSTLGIRAKMEGNGAMSESGGSFTDSQYDMIDDLSDVSNDDHDTASIASHDETSGQLSPEYAQSEADDTEDQTELLQQIETTVPSTSAESFVALSSPAPQSTSRTQCGKALSKHQMKAENDLIDSYTSEDLETPRQSTMPNVFGSTYRSSQRKSADRAMQAFQADPSTDHILFVSDRDMPVLDMNFICVRAACSLDAFDPSSKCEYTVKRLPIPPSGIRQASATVMRDGDSVSASIQHCVSAELRAASSYQLLILDSDEEHNSFFTIGEDAKIDLQRPNLAIFYLDSFTRGMAWFDTAYTAMQYLKVPILVIRDNDLVATKQTRINYGEGELQLVLDSKQFVAMERADLTTAINELLGKEILKVPSPSRMSRLEGGAKNKLSGSCTYSRFFLILLTVMLPMIMLATALSPAANPAADLTIRREALTFVLGKLADSTNITLAFNIEHLMPSPSINCTERSHLWAGASSCPVQPHAQQAPPNHVIVSLQNGPRDPHLVSVKAYRDDKRALSINQTKLMPGVYHVTIDPTEAHGNVNFNIITTRPMLNISWSNNFGNRLLQRQTYEKASTELSNIVSKDVAVMRYAAKGITEKMTTELGAGLWATKNVTSQLALYVTRDIQLAANTAVSVFVNAAKASNKTASNLGKDFILIQKGVTDFGENLSNLFKSRMKSVQANSKALIRAPLDISKHRLALSRKRLQDLKKAIQRPALKKPVVPEKKPPLNRFEHSLAAIPEHDKLKRISSKYARQAKAINEDWARHVDNFKDLKYRTRQQRKTSDGELR